MNAYADNSFIENDFIESGFAPLPSSSLAGRSDEPGSVFASWFTPTQTHGLDTNFIPSVLTRLPKPAKAAVRAATGVNRLLPLHNSLAEAASPLEFTRAALEALDIRLHCEGVAENIPSEGPVVIVSNHPFGGLDGIALLAAVLPRRPDFAVMVNQVLGIFPALRPAFLPLDILSGKGAFQNAAALRLAGERLKQGGAVGFFPAGAVSSWRLGTGISDPDWQSTAVRLALRCKASIVPVFFEGRNSLAFNLAGLAHPALRTLLLPSELWKKRGGAVRLTAGRPISPEALQGLSSVEDAAAYLRTRCYALVGGKARPAKAHGLPPIASSFGPDAVQDALEALPAEALLFQEGEYKVYSFKGKESPLLVEEIGRLREEVFRPAGEGSGKARDVDAFDADYHHLVLWHVEKRRIAGAYRLGVLKELLAERGVKGVYTSTLFRLSRDFLHRHAGAVELGRAVVHGEHQREYAPLLLLWKGIAAFVLRRPGTRCLFGPVSTPLDYQPASLRLITEFLSSRHSAAELAPMVRGRKKPASILRKSPALRLAPQAGYAETAVLVREMEENRTIPILFKHYLKLGGRIAAFHADKNFNSLDAFLFMDLADSPRPMLERYMGKEEAARFLAEAGKQASS